MIVGSALELTRAVEQGKGPAPDVAVLGSGLPAVYVRWLGPGYRFRLVAPYRILEDGLEIGPIFQGFEFDAASVPRPAWAAISPLDLGVVSVLVHDWFYKTGGQWGEFTRGQADHIFRRHMKAEGVSWWRRSAAYAAVRIAGRGSWRPLPDRSHPI